MTITVLFQCINFVMCIYETDAVPIAQAPGSNTLIKDSSISHTQSKKENKNPSLGLDDLENFNRGDPTSESFKAY